MVVVVKYQNFVQVEAEGEKTCSLIFYSSPVNSFVTTKMGI